MVKMFMKYVDLNEAHSVAKMVEVFDIFNSDSVNDTMKVFACVFLSKQNHVFTKLYYSIVSFWPLHSNIYKEV